MIMRIRNKSIVKNKEKEIGKERGGKKMKKIWIEVVESEEGEKVKSKEIRRIGVKIVVMIEIGRIFGIIKKDGGI